MVPRETPPSEPTSTSESSGPSRWRLAGQIVLAFVLFEAFWLIVLGPWVLPHPSARVATRFGGEASVFVWSLRWWPHALGHLADPLFSTDVWAPTGLNLAWVTTSPGLSIAAAPITLLAGPVAAFNALSLVIPGINATAGFVLARSVTRRFLPGLLGGFLFGLSPVVLREISQGHLNLSAIFLIPLAALLLLLRVQGKMGGRRFVVLLTLVLLAQFSIFIEVVATMAVMAGLVGLVGLAVAPKDRRPDIVRTAGLVAIAYGLMAVVVSPYLYALVSHPDARKPELFEGIALGAHRTADFLLFVNPGKGMLIGPAGGRGVPNFWYLGIPLLLLLAWFWIARRRSWGVRVLAFGFLIAMVLTVGPHLPIGHVRIPMPWTLFAKLPLVGRARPGRFVVYALLFGSVSAAMAVAGVRWSRAGAWERARGAATWALAALAVVSFLPRIGSDIWTIPNPTVGFIQSGQYRQYLGPHATVAVVGPYRGQQLFWQAETDFAFRLAAGYQGFLPADYADLQTALLVRSGEFGPEDGPAIRAYLRDHRVSAVIVGKGVRRRAVRTLSDILGEEAVQVGGVTLFPVHPG